MTMKTRLFAMVGVAAAIGFVLVGCEGPKRKMVEPPEGHKTTDGHKMACRLCYDEVVKTPPHPRYAPMGGVIRRHRCEGCKSDVSIYTEGGVTRVRCAKCAPDGMDCDKCLPPD